MVLVRFDLRTILYKGKVSCETGINRELLIKACFSFSNTTKFDTISASKATAMIHHPF